MRGFSAGAALLACACAAGCLTARYPAPEPFSAGCAEPSEVPARFAARVAPDFEQVNAVVFHYLWREFTALGVASVDQRTRSFAVSCMTPLGVKLFDLVCKDGRTEGRFALPELAKRGGPLAQAAGEDLAHAYFDWAPPAGAPWALERGRLVVAAADAAGVTEYRYAWRDGRLAEKRRIEGGHRVWTVAYYAYAQRANGLVPSALVIENHRRRYRLEASMREEAQ
jgi:hypothetical protein